MGQNVKSPLIGKSISDLFSNREAWDRFCRNETYKAVLKGLGALEKNEFTTKLWGYAGKEFFENNFPDPKRDALRKKFNRVLESLLGEATWRFWAYAYLLYQVLLSEEGATQKKVAKDSPEKYKYNEADYKKAMRILLRLYKKGYIIYPYPLFITQKKPVLESTLKAMWRKKQRNVFIYLAGIPLGNLTQYKAADLLMDFFLAYLPNMVGYSVDVIKKALKRPPF